MYVYIHMYMYIYKHMNLNMYVSIDISIDMHTYIYIYIYDELPDKGDATISSIYVCVAATFFCVFFASLFLYVLYSHRKASGVTSRPDSSMII